MEMHLMHVIIPRLTHVFAGSQNGQSALHRSSERGHVEVCALLISHGARVETKDQVVTTIDGNMCARGKRCMVQLQRCVGVICSVLPLRDLTFYVLMHCASVYVFVCS